MDDKFATYVGNRRLHNFLTLDEYRSKKGKALYIIRHNRILIKGKYSPLHKIKL